MPVARLLSVLIAGMFVAPAFGVEAALHSRDGLPQVAAQATTADGQLRVAYLGGSITAADGWRSLTTTHLRTLFPQLTVTEITAGLPGTGSDLGACRLERDVLRHRPDLLFVEFAVNDTGASPERIERTMEGIVRQTWRTHPRTDICFVYTVSTPGLPDLQAGKFPAAAQAMERVATHYGIPALHFGIEISRRLAIGELVFKDPAAPDNPRTFSLDGVHPTAAGHRVYACILQQALPSLLKPSAPRPRALPPPVHVDNWESAGLRLIDEVVRHGDWKSVVPDDPGLRGVTKALLPPVWRAENPGAQIEFEFQGRIVGLLGIGAPDSGVFRVTVDDLPPVTGSFFDSYASPTFCRAREWFYPVELGDGPHRVRVELLATVLDKASIKAKAGRPISDPEPYGMHWLTLCGVLVVGTPSP